MMKGKSAADDVEGGADTREPILSATII